MKKILLIIAFLLILIAIPLTVFLAKQSQDNRQKAAPATVLFIEPATITVNADDTFDVEIKAETGENRIAAAEIHLNFSSTYLEAISIQNGELFPNVFVSGSVQSGTASITVGSDTASGGLQGTNVLVARAKFKALRNTEAGTPTLIEFGSRSQISAVGEEGIDVLRMTQPASVTIGQAQGGATPTPQASASPGGSPQASPSITPSATPGGTPRASATATPKPTATPGTTQTTKITAPANGATVTTKRPTISVTSFPNALIVMTIENTQIAATDYANASGTWSYTPTTDLANGTYTITVTGTSTGSGTPETAQSTFTVNVGGTGGPNTSPSPSSSATSGATTTPAASSTPASSGTGDVPVTGTVEVTMALFGIAVALLLFGGITLFR